MDQVWKSFSPIFAVAPGNPHGSSFSVCRPVVTHGSGCMSILEQCFVLVRIGRICSSYKQFYERHYKLTRKLIKQGFRYVELRRTFKRFAKTHSNIIYKYGYSAQRHIADGICLPACDQFLGRHVSSHRRSHGTAR